MNGKTQPKIHDTTMYRRFNTIRAHAADLAVAEGEAVMVGLVDDVEAFVSDIKLSST
jgi:hypothetical protein